MRSVNGALTALFLVRDWGMLGHLLPLMVYGLAMVELYTVSAIFHLGTWRPKPWHVLRMIDHASIFVAIAATDTALCLPLLTGWWRDALLAGIWLLAITGIGLKICAPQLPRGASTAIYIGLSWTILPAVPALWASSTSQAHVLFGPAAILYLLGALVYWRRRPNPLPGVFGYHELFHVLTIARSIVVATVVRLSL
ncbi:MAG TPA: hemolysin III family protein [Ktedonobacterales bacterium]|nr:hemolysin III family protein [Ktedonobacterales bacterium]